MAKKKSGAKNSQWMEIWRSLKSNKVSLICLIFIVLLFLLSISVDIIFDYEEDIIKQAISERLQFPSMQHWFGTDAYGRDYFSRIVYASRITMFIALASTFFAALFGILIGAGTAFFSAKLDNIVQRLLDIVMAVPTILLAICVVAVLGGGVINMIIAFTISQIPKFSRIIRSSVLVIKENEYIEAAEAIGESKMRTLITHLIPNTLGIALVQITMNISYIILSTAALGYLGLGVSAPEPEWGLMLSEAREFMRSEPYLILIPGVVIVVTALAFNLLGDGLRDAMDPKLKGYRRSKGKEVLPVLPISENISKDEVLRISNLHVKYSTPDGDVMAVNDVSLSLNKSERLGIVGETGAGKTTLALSILRLLPKGVGIPYKGDIYFKGESIHAMDAKNMRAIRGNRISMIFQDPMTSLNPILTVGDQIAEVLRQHGIRRQDADKRVDELLQLVGIEPSRKICYPNQLSGGMKQRIVIAIALACEPDLLIADEPTTALDVTIQSQVLAMIDEIQKKLQTSLIMITHDFGIVAECCDKVAIMYAGEIIEYGEIEQIFDKENQHHPYTVGLFNSIPDLYSNQKRLDPIPGLMPDPRDLPKGCAFVDRCPYRMELCKNKKPVVRQFPDGRQIKCHLFLEDEKIEGRTGC